MKNLDPMQPNRRILVVDDTKGIHEDLRKILATDNAHETALLDHESVLFNQPGVPTTRFELDYAYQGQEGLQRLNESLAEGRPYALAFVDIRMPPGWDGVETTTQLWKACPELQVVICTAFSDYSWPQMVQRLGYSDNFLILKKPFDNMVVRQIAHALTRKWAVTRQASLQVEDLDRLVIERTTSLRAANEQFQLSERRFSKAFGANPIPLALQAGAEGRFIDANQRFLDLSDYSRAELIGRTPLELRLWPEAAEGKAWMNSPPTAHGLREFASQMRTRTGVIRDTLVSTETLEIGPSSHRLLIVQDISDRVRLEDRVRQAQKLEAVGQLAGGIAHDFNNALAVILGNLSLAEKEATPNSAVAQVLREAAAGAYRAKALTTQLLTFSKGGKPVKTTTALEPILQAASLAALRGSDTKCYVRLPADLWPVQADAAQLGQAFQNLMLNARQAMAEQGEIRIEVSNKTTTPADGRSVKAGDYVQVTLQDHGEGIANEHLGQIFDPYFTTKKTGSGLGLAVVYSIVKNHHGHLSVESNLGVGTAFTLWLPADRSAPTSSARNLPPKPILAKRILVMDDEEMLRVLLNKMLRRQGAEVELAADGAAAIKVYAQALAEGRRFDLVIMDLTVPRGMGGQDAIQRLLELDPDVKAIVSSGYSDNPVMADHRAYGFCGVIHKPYTLEQLTAELQSIGHPEPIR